RTRTQAERNKLHVCTTEIPKHLPPLHAAPLPLFESRNPTGRFYAWIKKAPSAKRKTPKNERRKSARHPALEKDPRETGSPSRAPSHLTTEQDETETG
ncbi:hypothetical protein, partial [Pyramidobacter sp. C12-8]|uniref:hypothetical protein n=1 Tax=Pyramidobacter sp. C12-8 TaxID=1943580 RepID=UPI00197EFF1E